MTNVRTYFTEVQKPVFEKKYKMYNEPSLTIPDQTMSIREMLERFARGLPLTGNNSEPVYEGDEGLGVDIRTLDLSELHDLKEGIKQEISDIRTKHASETTKKEKDALKAALKRELDAENELKNKTTDNQTVDKKALI